MTRIVCLADTHNLHKRVDVPAGDVVVFAGDMTSSGTSMEVRNFFDWLYELPHPHKVVIAGNHDWIFERNPAAGKLAARLYARAPSITYLDDSGATIAGLKFWGSPVQWRFNDWAFNRERGADLQRHWDMIPADTEVLVTHAPPKGILDQVTGQGSLGCENLRATINGLKKLRLSVFGHLHKDGGKKKIMRSGKIFVNAAICTDDYVPSRRPVVVDL